MAIRKTLLPALLLGVLLTLGMAPLPKPAQTETPAQVIAAVNQFRTAHGLPALEVDYALMGAAQAHSDYQASIGQVTHTGPGGSRPIDRAYAWGFGNGATAFVSENIAGGYRVTIQIAIYDFWQDEAHLHTMLNPNAVYIGAGVATSGSSTYYTVDTGYYVGSRPRPTSDPNATPPPAGNNPPGPTAVAYDPFIISTPREDGAIIHVVGYGQTLIGIANTYGVPLEDIYRYNHYDKNTVIYPNEWVIIRPADETAITGTPENPGTPLPPTRTEAPQKPTRTPRTAQSTRPAVIVNPTATPAPEPVTLSDGDAPLVLAVVGLSLLVLIGVIAYGLLNRK
jgi:hypothetical protein